MPREVDADTRSILRDRDVLTVPSVVVQDAKDDQGRRDANHAFRGRRGAPLSRPHRASGARRHPDTRHEAKRASQQQVSVAVNRDLTNSATCVAQHV
jgi:hypothetical protein